MKKLITGIMVLSYFFSSSLVMGLNASRVYSQENLQVPYLETEENVNSNRGIFLVWDLSQRAKINCQKLVESFVVELQSIAVDRKIELIQKTEVDKSSGMFLEISCGESDYLKVDQVLMRYHKKSESFDAEDWLIFQKKYLRESIFVHNTEPNIGLSAVEKSSEKIEMKTEGQKFESTPLYKKWWFWTIIGVAGAGVFAATQWGFGSKSGNMNVEIR